MKDFHLLGGCGCLTTAAGLGLVLFGIVNNLILKYPEGGDPAHDAGYVVGSLCCCPGPVLMAGIAMLGAAVVRQRAQAAAPPEEPTSSAGGPF